MTFKTLKSFHAGLSNSAEIWSLISTGLRLGGIVLVLPIVLKKLSSEEMGLWYVFSSIGIIGVLIDMGFWPTIQRATSYLWGGAPRLSDFGVVTRNPSEAHETQPNIDELSKLIRTCRIFYRILAILLFVILGFGLGAWLWHRTVDEDNATVVRLAYLFYVISLTYNLAVAYWGALLAGINQVRLSQQVQCSGFLANYAVMSVGLFMGLGLWAMVLGLFVKVVFERELGKWFYRRCAGATLVAVSEQHVDWPLIHTLWPMAWRSGVLGIGTYLIINANTLVSAQFLTLEQTASYGLSMQIGLFLVGISAVWVQVKIPWINQMRTRAAIQDITSLFIRRMSLALATFLAGAIALILVGDRLLVFIGSNTHLLPTPILGLLFLFLCLEMHHSLYASLVLTENQNPFVAPALLSGVCIISMSILLVPRWGTAGLIISYGIVQLCFNNWWTVLRGIKGLGLTKGSYVRMILNIMIGRFR